MTIPAQDFTIGEGIIIGIAIYMMCFPSALSASASIFPHQLLVACALMPMPRYPTFTFTANYVPTRFDSVIQKCHFAPPPIWYFALLDHFHWKRKYISASPNVIKAVDVPRASGSGATCMRQTSSLSSVVIFVCLRLGFGWIGA